MDGHKQLLDKEYETLLQQFSKELEKLQIKHQQELEKKVVMNYIMKKCIYFKNKSNIVLLKLYTFLYILKLFFIVFHFF